MVFIKVWSGKASWRRGEGEAFDGSYPRKSRESMIQEQRMGSPAEPGTGKRWRGLVAHRGALRTRGTKAWGWVPIFA